MLKIKHAYNFRCDRNKSFFSFIIANALNKDQRLIQIKCLEKVEHHESIQRYTHGPSVTLTDGPLYISLTAKGNLTLVRRYC